MDIAAHLPTTLPSTRPAFLGGDGPGDLLQLLKEWPGQTDLLEKCQTMNTGVAVALIVVGVVYLLWGYTAFKAIVTINACLIGAYAGAILGDKGGAALPGALIGGFTAAAVTWPLMKYGVAVMGGLVGAVIGMSLWRSIGLDVHFAPAGGMVGLVFFGMLSFILFRTSVMMFTSLQGSMMLIFGLLGLIYKSDVAAQSVTHNLSVSPVIIPTAVFIASIVGVVYQTNNTGEPAKK